MRIYTKETLITALKDIRDLGFIPNARHGNHGGIQKIIKLSQFSFDGFLQGLREGFVLVDFDARTGHNHGTKFRLRQNRLPDLYEHAEEI
jgi:MvaI/BcnI restriction endonuclease family